MDEYSVGQMFDIDEKTYVVKECGLTTTCRGCAGDFTELCYDLPECEATMRKDNTEVIFKEVNDVQRRN